MKATVVDLRYRMNDVLKALDRNEEVEILYHGKLKGTIAPAGRSSVGKVSEHPFFGMARESPSIQEQMDRLRGGRYRDL